MGYGIGIVRLVDGSYFRLFLTTFLVVFFAGIQFFILGIMGEYLARMHQNLIGMPPYVVREAVGAILTSKLERPTDKNS